MTKRCLRGLHYFAPHPLTQDPVAIREKSKRDERDLKKKAANAATVGPEKKKAIPETTNNVQQKKDQPANFTQHTAIEREQTVKDNNGRTRKPLSKSANTTVSKSSGNKIAQANHIPKAQKRKVSSMSGSTNGNDAIAETGETRESQAAGPKVSEINEQEKSEGTIDEGSKDETQRISGEPAGAAKEPPTTPEEWRKYFLHDMVFELR